MIIFQKLRKMSCGHALENLEFSGSCYDEHIVRKFWEGRNRDIIHIYIRTVDR